MGTVRACLGYILFRQTCQSTVAIAIQLAKAVPQLCRALTAPTTSDRTQGGARPGEQDRGQACHIVFVLRVAAA